MEALLLLIPLALLFCLVAVKAFFWAVGNRQFDNLDSAARSILFDDDDAPRNSQLHNNRSDKSNGNGN